MTSFVIACTLFWAAVSLPESPDTLAKKELMDCCNAMRVSIQNIESGPRKLAFDIYLFNTKPGTPMELAGFQAGILLDYNWFELVSARNIEVTIKSGSSALNPEQAPESISVVEPGIIRIAAKRPPGPGNGSIISSKSHGTRVCRVIITLRNLVSVLPSVLAGFTGSRDSTLFPTRISFYTGNTNQPCTIIPGINAFTGDPPK